MALGSPASKERGVNTHFAGSAGLGELAKTGSHPEGVRMLEHDPVLSWCWTLSSPLFVFPPGSFYAARYLYQWVESRISLRSTASVNVMMDRMPSEGRSSHGEIGLLGSINLLPAISQERRIKVKWERLNPTGRMCLEAKWFSLIELLHWVSMPYPIIKT